MPQELKRDRWSHAIKLATWWPVFYTFVAFWTLLGFTMGLAQSATVWTQLAPLARAQEFLGYHAVLPVLATASTLVVPAAFWLRAKGLTYLADAAQVDLNSQVILLEEIDYVVNEKQKTLSDTLSRYGGREEFSPEEFLKHCVQPAWQYRAIAESLYRFFRARFRKRIGIRVLLVSTTKRGRVREAEAWAPESGGPLTDSLTQLKGPDTAFAKAHEMRDLLIIEDLAKEVGKKSERRRYKPVDGDRAAGSVLVYPVASTPFVLSIKATLPGTFRETEADHEKWSYVLGRFALRIRTEHTNERLLRALERDHDAEEAEEVQED